MADKTNVSLETADCLVRKSAFGNDVIHNICTGTVKTIPWEMGDWVTMSLGAFFVLIALAVVGLLLVALFH